MGDPSAIPAIGDLEYPSAPSDIWSICCGREGAPFELPFEYVLACERARSPRKSAARPGGRAGSDPPRSIGMVSPLACGCPTGEVMPLGPLGKKDGPLLATPDERALEVGERALKPGEVGPCDWKVGPDVVRGDVTGLLGGGTGVVHRGKASDKVIKALVEVRRLTVPSKVDAVVELLDQPRLHFPALDPEHERLLPHHHHLDVVLRRPRRHLEMLPRQRRVTQPQIRPLRPICLEHLLRSLVGLHALANEEQVREDEDVAPMVVDLLARRVGREEDLDVERTAELASEGKIGRGNLEAHFLLYGRKQMG